MPRRRRQAPLDSTDLFSAERLAVEPGLAARLGAAPPEQVVSPTPAPRKQAPRKTRRPRPRPAAAQAEEPTPSPPQRQRRSKPKTSRRGLKPTGNARRESDEEKRPSPAPAPPRIRITAAQRRVTGAPFVAEAQQLTESHPTLTYAISTTDPERAYVMRFRVVDLDNLIPSQLPNLAPNPAFPQELQPRERGRLASRRQIESIAKRLSPLRLIVDTHALQEGAPIVGPDNLVESGNGRVLALILAREQMPERYGPYLEAVREDAMKKGIELPEATDDPILVRQREAPDDESVTERRRFVDEANDDPTLGTSPVEDAWREAEAIPDWVLTQFAKLDEEIPDANVDKILNSAGFHPAIQAYIEGIPRNEVAALVNRSGTGLNVIGKQRFKSALFAKVFGESDATRNLMETFTEDDTAMRNVEAALFSSLRSLGELKGKIELKQLPPRVDITDDLSAAAAHLAMLRSRGLPVAQFVNQSALEQQDDMSPMQRTLLQFFDEYKFRPKQMREVLHSFAVVAAQQRQPGQGSLVPMVDSGSHAIFKRVLKEHKDRHREDFGAVDLFGVAQKSEEWKAQESMGSTSRKTF